MKAILFDLDNTLYPPKCDLFSLIDVRINRYMKEVVAINPADVDGLRRSYWKDYGATLRGLIHHHDVDPEDYLDYVHAVDVSSRLSINLDLQRTLNNLQVPSYIFTNGSRCHADRVIAALGLEGLFVDIFDIRIATYQPKPHLDPYRQVLKTLALDGKQCIMVEDQLQNLQTAKQLGMKTILVSEAPTSTQPNYIDAHVTKPADIHEIVSHWTIGG